MEKEEPNVEPRIEVTDYAENEDGSVAFEFKTNEAFDRMYLARTGKKRVTKKGLSKYVLELLEKAIDKIDGYDMETVDK